MTTHTHANDAARSAGHPSVEVLTAAEADAIVGGGLFDWIEDAVDAVRKGVRKIVKWPKKAFEAARDWVMEQFDRAPDWPPRDWPLPR